MRLTEQKRFITTTQTEKQQCNLLVKYKPFFAMEAGRNQSCNLQHQTHFFSVEIHIGTALLYFDSKRSNSWGKILMEILLAAILVREIFTMTVLKHTNYILLLSNTKIY